MVQVLKSLLALTSLLILALVAIRANSAPLLQPDEQWQAAGTSYRTVCRPLRRLPPAAGPSLLGARTSSGNAFAAPAVCLWLLRSAAPASAVFHTSNRGDWYQWSFYRPD